MHYRQIIQNFAYTGELVNTTVVEWIDPLRQGDARNATPEDLAAVGDATASGYLAEIERLKEAHTAEIEAITAAHAAENHQSRPGGISKLTLKRRLDQIGKWADFKAFLASLGEVAVDEFNLAAEIRSDDPMFIQIAPLAKQALGLDDETYASLLAP